MRGKDDLFTGTIKTLQNGFFELWLPRNHKINLNIEREGLAANGTIETLESGMTCITTFRLQ